MEDKIKCFTEEHKEIKAISFCPECKIYMCNKCEKIHSGLCILHHEYKLDTDVNQFFGSFCKEENHSNKLQYFCKDHNILCCVACIAKIEGEGNGQHKNCNVCLIKNIKEEKKNKLNENIKYLEDLSKNLDESIKNNLIWLFISIFRALLKQL